MEFVICGQKSEHGNLEIVEEIYYFYMISIITTKLYL